MRQGAIQTSKILEDGASERIVYKVRYELEGNSTRYHRELRVDLIAEGNAWKIDNIYYPAGTFPMLGQEQNLRHALDWLSAEMGASIEWAKINKDSLKTQKQILKGITGVNVF